MRRRRKEKANKLGDSQTKKELTQTTGKHTKTPARYTLPRSPRPNSGALYALGAHESNSNVKEKIDEND